MSAVIPADTLHAARCANRVATSALAMFFAAAVALHGLRPDLDPVASQMSLYLIGAWGPLLQAAYVALAVGMVALGWGLRAAHAPQARSAAALLLFAMKWPVLRTLGVCAALGLVAGLVGLPIG